MAIRNFRNVQEIPLKTDLVFKSVNGDVPVLAYARDSDLNEIWVTKDISANGWWTTPESANGWWATPEMLYQLVPDDTEGDSVVMGSVYSTIPSRNSFGKNGAAKTLFESAKILSDRGKRYDNDADDPYPAVTRTAALWATYLGCEVTPQQAADMMALHKLARLSVDPTGDDHRLDGINYLAIGEDLSSGTRD